MRIKIENHKIFLRKKNQKKTYETKKQKNIYFLRKKERKQKKQM